MLKKLLIPCFVFAAAVAVGCSSSNDNKTGTAGTSGGAAGTTGAAGSAAGTTGTAGSAAGTTGTAGSTAGTTGTAGSTAGTTGTAGSTAGTTGTAGSTAGTTGTAGAGGTGGGTAGTGGTGGGTDAGTDAALPACTSTTMGSTPMTAATFCKIFLADCGTTHTGLTTEAECETTYEALATSKPMRQHCQSYHLCNANGFAAGSSDRTAHCSHAGADPGNGVCTQTN
jgi:hypothetical protein